MIDRIAIRSVPEDVMKGLGTLAARHDRSVEAEARFALRSWVEPLMQQQEQSARRREVSARLRELLQEVNRVRRGSPLRPSHIAIGIKEAHAEPVEKWFSGELEPSFHQLAAVAAFLGGECGWLQHGDGHPFPVNMERIPEGAEEGVRWLLDMEGASQEVDHLHLVRSSSKEGSLVVVKEYAERRCQTYTTPYHVSEVIGAGGESSLTHLSVVWHLLYKFYCRRGKPGLIVKSYILPEAKFSALVSGRIHPLAILGGLGGTPWWEDFWDRTQFQKDSQSEYWPGWHSVCNRIYDAVEHNSRLRHERDLITSEKHCLLTEAED